jgi:protein SCO1/2
MQARILRGLAGLLLIGLWGLAQAEAGIPMPTDAWHSDDGSVVRISDFGGHPLLVAMAYSSCTRTCPVTMKRLRALETQARARGEAPIVLVVSYDPVKDTPEVWTRYRRAHHIASADWHFLSGSSAQTRALARILGIADYWRYDEHIMHDFAIGIVSGEGQLAEVKRWNDG